MLSWSLRQPALVALLAMGFAAGVIDLFGGIFNWLLSAMWWLLAFKLASEALSRAASGRGEQAGFEVFASDGLAMRQMALGLWLIAIAALLQVLAPAGASIAYGIVLAVLLPAIVIVLVMEESLLRAFDPRCWLELVRRVGTEYFTIAGQIVLLAVAVVLAIRLLAAALPSGPAEAIAHLLVLYLMLVSYGSLGALLDRHREQLNLDHDGPKSAPPSARLAAATPEETAALAEAGDLLAADQPAQAAAVLDRLIRGRGATAPVHARYRALLTRLGDREGLLRHARLHVAVLLQLGQERDAVALYLEAKQMDPGFELDDPQPISELIEIAARNQQSKLAVSLAEEFMRRFPRDRDLVANGLAAAKLMDRLDRDEEARRLLSDLLARFPEHPLQPELQAALQAIDAVSPPASPRD
jgi:tetratricopeptide (TPR) repeat protein